VVKESLAPAGQTGGRTARPPPFDRALSRIARACRRGHRPHVRV